MRPKIIYICSPYTPIIKIYKSDIGENIDYEDYKKAACLYHRNENISRANESGKRIFELGHTPLIPHNNTARWEDDSRFKNIDHAKWIEMCLNLLRVCDGILMCPGWEGSSGCREELEYFAKEIGGVIYYDLSEVVRFGEEKHL